MLLVIDNYDSFVYNLVHYVEDFGVRADVIRNDAMSAAEAFKKKPKAILLSPGPGAPHQAGICLDLLKAAPRDLPYSGRLPRPSGHRLLFRRQDRPGRQADARQDVFDLS